ncbi:MAG: hypothetical protein O3C43_24480 [Verrucomicrobia bacterium]|nr:hypothetical protein [Verrucomicrobiota bacterium]
MPEKSAHLIDRHKIALGWLIPSPLFGFLPLYIYWENFAKFYFQGDEWEQLHLIESTGYWTWVFSFFGENFVPVFKLFWSSILFLGNGDYHVFLYVSFTVHAAVVFLLGYLLRMWSFGLISILFSQLVLALNYTHIEILNQSIQVSNLLSYCLLLITLIVFSKPLLEGRVHSQRVCVFLSILSALGALSFARGILIGAVVFLMAITLLISSKAKNKRLLRPAMFALIPSLFVGILVGIGTYIFSDNFADSASRLGLITKHFLYQISLNPWYQQIRGFHIKPSLALLLFELNVVFVFFAFRWVKDHQRPLIILLLGFFLGNAFLLALGRNHLPIDHVAGWRYQYGVLIVFAPMVGVVVEKILNYPPFKFFR